MENVNLAEEDIRNLIIYGLTENNIDVNSIDSKQIDMAIEDYLLYYSDFKQYVKGELDTFKIAACLLIAINKNRLSADKRINASIAIDASQKMCEKPYWHIGPNADIPYQMEEVDFKKLFKNDSSVYDKHRSMLTKALVYEDGAIPISIYINLELFYRVAIEIKKEKFLSSFENRNQVLTCPIQERSIVDYTANSKATSKKRKRKLFPSFRK